ncbi:MAG: phosphodiester glycosidase family protein [Kofleriaceae bacterium]
MLRSRCVRVRVRFAVVVVIACGKPDPTPMPIVAAPVADAAVACAARRVALPAGLVGERWTIAATPIAGEPCIDVVRADLAALALRAFTDPKRRTAPAWRDGEHLIAVTNAGMFHDDNNPVGLVIDRGNVRGVDNPKFGGFVAWDPVAAGDPPVISVGSSCAGFDLAALRVRYRSLVQGYRLLDCDGHALPWKDPKQYSAVALAVDRAGRLVFLHARGAVTMGELSVSLAGHDLAGAIFLEGGPEASLIAGDLSLIGSYETGFVENDDNREPWALPNVLGLVRRQP